MTRDELIEAMARSHYANYFDGLADIEPTFSEQPESHQDRMRGAMSAALTAIEAHGLAIVPVDFPETKFDENEEPTDLFHKTWSKAHKDSIARYGKPALASYTFFSKLWKPMIDTGKL